MCVALTADRFGSFGEGWIETSQTDSNKFRHHILWVSLYDEAKANMAAIIDAIMVAGTYKQAPSIIEIRNHSSGCTTCLLHMSATHIATASSITNLSGTLEQTMRHLHMTPCLLLPYNLQ